MTTLCIVTYCMGRLAHLKQSLGAMAAQRGCSCVLVDWSCPERCGDWAEVSYPQVKVVRVPGKTHYSAAGARNTAARAADAPWICFMDADVVPDPRFAGEVIPRLVTGHSVHALPQVTGTIGTYILARETFGRTPGYDEVLRFYGDEDYDMIDCLRYLGVPRASFPAALLRPIDHSNDMRVQNFPCQVLRQGTAVNRVYRVLKWVLAAARGAFVTPDECRQLYDELEPEVPAIMQREGLADTGKWRWEPFARHIAGQFERIEGRPPTDIERVQIRDGLEMRRQA